MRHAHHFLAVAALAATTTVTVASDGSGLRISAEASTGPRWQTRVSVVGAAARWVDASSGLASTNAAAGSLSLMGDYYLTPSLPGQRGAGGFRATSGIVIGPRGQTLTSSLAASQGGGQATYPRVFGLSGSALLPGDASVDSATLPYVGLGYSGYSSREGWSFNADLGLISRSFDRASRFGTQSLDETVRNMRWQPMLQLGASYSF